MALVLSCAKSTSNKDDSNKDDSNKDKVNPSETKDASSSALQGHATEVYWGDTHLHTEFSMDAGAFGNTLDLNEAYKFAKGEEVISSTGLKAKLARPLDFLVVADHSDGMGLFQAIKNSDEWVMKTDQGKRWNELINSGKGSMAAIELIKAFSQKELDMDPNNPDLQKSIWSMTVEAAEKYNIITLENLLLL